MQRNAQILKNLARRWTVGIFGVIVLSGCGAVPGRPAVTAPSTRATQAPAPPSSAVPEVPVHLTHLWMSTPQNGVGVGLQGMYTTTDGARRWTTVALPGPSPAELANDAKALPTGLAAANLVAIGIAPHGIVWTVKQIPSQAQIAVYWTPNRGTTWYGGSFTTHLFAQGVPVWMDNISFLGPRHAWLALQPEHGMNSEPGDLWYTQTAGKTWTRVAATPPDTTSGTLPVGGAVTFISRTHGWDLGQRGSTAPNLLWVTQDGAKRWTQVSLPGYSARHLSVLMLPRFFGHQGILPVEYVPASHKTVDFTTILYHSANAGQTWVPATPVPASPTPTIDSINATTTWLWTGYQDTSDAGSPVHGTLEVTEDGGTHWSQRIPTGILRKLMAKGYTITHLDFLNRQQGWATTTKLDNPQDGPLLETRNGGRSWQRLNPIVQPSS